MSDRVIDIQVSKPNALRRKYERDDVGAGRNSRVLNRVDDSGGQCTGGIFGPGFSEELP